MSILSTAVTSTCAVAYMSPASISRPPSYVQYALACPRDSRHVLGKMAGRALGRLHATGGLSCHTATSRKENELAFNCGMFSSWRRRTHRAWFVYLVLVLLPVGRCPAVSTVPLSSASVHRGRQPLVNYWARRSPPLKTRDPDGVDQGTRWQR
jgi:hypothetical protein